MGPPRRIEIKKIEDLSPAWSTFFQDTTTRAPASQQSLQKGANMNLLQNRAKFVWYFKCNSASAGTNATLNSDCSRMMGKELDGLSLKELDELEKQLNQGILSVKKEGMNCFGRSCTGLNHKNNILLRCPLLFLNIILVLRIGYSMFQAQMTFPVVVVNRKEVNI
ncbi:hypothetical protein M0R45_026864 [Rubus argutus]|uniref:K-box domain-containing protein n=1 Tax=Rubus argutus TaxID=59490 RepID=A0AAW1X0K0_RUBAR